MYVTFHVPVLTFNWTHFPIDCWLRLTPDSGSGAGVVAVLFILIKHKTSTWHFHKAHLLDYFISPRLFNRKPGLTFLEICIKGRNDCAGKASDTALVLILNVKFTLLHPDTPHNASMLLSRTVYSWSLMKCRALGQWITSSTQCSDQFFLGWGWGQDFSRTLFAQLVSIYLGLWPLVFCVAKYQDSMRCIGDF